MCSVARLLRLGGLSHEHARDIIEEMHYRMHYEEKCMKQLPKDATQPMVARFDKFSKLRYMLLACKGQWVWVIRHDVPHNMDTYTGIELASYLERDPTLRKRPITRGPNYDKFVYRNANGYLVGVSADLGPQAW